MEIDHSKVMQAKSDQDLKDYVVNRKKFHFKVVFAAIEELEKRGDFFSKEELSKIKDDLNEEKSLAAKRAEANESKTWDKNAVKDEAAISLYSQSAILGFSIFFGVITGAILLAINCSRTENRKQSYQIVIFGIAYTFAQILILSLFERSTGLTLGASIGGAYLLNMFFWKNYIGAETQYRKRSVWVPLGIASLIVGSFIAIVIYLDSLAIVS